MTGPDDNLMALSYLGIGVVGLATGGILRAVDPGPPQQPVSVSMGPGFLGVRGTF